MIIEKCIFCGGKIIAQCGCSLHDTFCENRHVYHRVPESMEIHKGESLHHPIIIDCCMEKDVLGTYFIHNEQIHFRPLHSIVFNEIVNIMQTEYNITNLTLQTKILEDLGFENDTKKMMLIKIDTLTGREIPINSTESINTVGDIVRIVGEVWY